MKPVRSNYAIYILEKNNEYKINCLEYNKTKDQFNHCLSFSCIRDAMFMAKCYCDNLQFIPQHGIIIINEDQ